MNAVSPPPAGWYPDPSGRAPFRYWDGARWTEHTDQGTAPAPSPTAPAAPPAPAAPSMAPMYTPAAPAYQPAAPGYAPAAPGTPVSAGAPAGGAWTAQSFMEDLKKLEGMALVVVGFVVFMVASFFPWAEGTASRVDPATGLATEVTDSGNAWDDEGTPWLIRGFSLDDLRKSASPDSGTDMLILLPIGLIAVGVAVGSKVGKKIQYANEIVLGASALLAILLIAEAVHVSGEIEDISAAYAANGILFEGGLAFGIYIGIIGGLAMAGGAVKHYLANKQATA